MKVWKLGVILCCLSACGTSNNAGGTTFVADTGSHDDADAAVEDAVDGAAPDDASQADIAASDVADVKLLDLAAPDVPPPDVAKDVMANGPTVSAAQQDESSQNCPAGQKIVITTASLKFEPVVATSPSVTVQGSGTSSSTTFFVAAQTGPFQAGAWSGAQVVVNTAPFPVKPGDVMQFTAGIQENYCNTQILVDAASVSITGSAAAPVPTTVAVVDLAGISAEPFEGALIALNDLQVEDPNPKYDNNATHGDFIVSHQGGGVTLHIALAPGSFFATKGSFGPETMFLPKGQTFKSITGNLVWTGNVGKGFWTLQTRGDGDIVKQ
jgi:hypothetical protein